MTSDARTVIEQNTVPADVEPFPDYCVQGVGDGLGSWA